MTRRAETLPATRPYAIAAGYVALATLAAEVLYRALDSNRLSMIFLAAVLVAAVRLGRGPAFFAAVLGFVIYNFYLVEPRFILWFGSAEDYFVLVAFLGVALLTGGLAGRLRDENLSSQARARRMATLFEATRELSALGAEETLRERLAARLAEAVGGAAWVVPADGAEPAAWAAMPHDDQDRLRRLLRAPASLGAEGDTAAEGPWRMRTLVADGRRMGLAIWRAPGGRAGPEAEDLARVLAEVGAQALGRARLGAEKAAAETVAGAERLRTALLSSISHDFRTPLAAILASATSLIEFEDSFDKPTRADLLSTIQEEAERLNRFVANLLNMTRLESGVLELNIAPVPVQEAAARALEHLRRRIGPRRARLTGPGEPVLAYADPVLLEQVLTNLIENAVAFSPETSALDVRIGRFGGQVELEVADQGAGVPAADLPRIFEKFYRASNARQSAQGAGLGLSICRGLVEAMGGTIEARARTDGGPGLSVFIQLQEA